MNQINRSCPLFSFLVNGRAFFDEETCICDVNTDFVDLILLKLVDIYSKFIKIFFMKLSDWEGIIKISCSQGINCEDFLVSQIHSLCNFLRWNLVLSMDVCLINELFESILNLFRVFFFVNVMCLEQSLRLDLYLSEPSILRYNSALRVLWIAIPAVELYKEVFLVDFF